MRVYLASNYHSKLQGRFLLDAAVLSVGVFEAQTQFRFVALQVEQLLGVEGSATPPGKEIRFHSEQEAAQERVRRSDP